MPANERSETPQPALQSLIRSFAGSPATRGLLRRLGQVPGRQDLRCSGLTGSARSLLLQSLAEECGRPILFLCANPEDAYALAQDMEHLPCSGLTERYPALGKRPYEFALPSGETLGRRISALAALDSGRARILIAPLVAALEPTLSRARLASESATLHVGSEFDFEALVAILIRLGFRRVPNVEEIGDFSQRGGLLDFFSPGATSPVRVEFFGDTVESIRTFEVTDQRTRNTLETVTLLPRREALYDSASIEALLESLTPAEEEVLRSRTVSDPEAPGLEWLAPFLEQTQETLLDHLPENTLILTDGAGALRQDAEDLMREDARLRERAASELPFLRRHPGFYRSPDAIFTEPSYTTIDILPFRGSDTTVVDFNCKEPPPIGGNMDALATALASYRTTDITYLICADNPGQAERIRELVHDNFPGEDPPVIVALFQGGFFCPDARIALLTDHQIFKRQYRRRQRKHFKEGVALTSYTNLEPGDYVVHTEHGIARYLRLETLTLDKRHRDCLQLEYADNDKLYVPIEEFNRVSKYAGKEARPSLTQLGGAAWERAKQRAQKGIEELAERLVRLYAERKARPGHAFPPDTSWMRRLEASFPYEETEDQQKAIDAVKTDMENSGAADRLICGDVGFGKTEVAVRAALKCVEDGRQVGLLAPTTILAQQHFNTFSERLKDFPVRIDLMSRFRTANELNATEQAVRAGQVDILIGTHRLLNMKVEFQNLGLLVIDEEQRFGVKQKERLRELKTTVDTLTLTATPIPRTLQLSLSGARDMSLITTSPRGRLPITTAVTEFSPETIAQAILREIDRDGQVFFVHNRVQTIDAVRRYLKKLLPQIEILVGHGQMPERELERVMINFVNKKAQVLLCTAIIESGLDIPNVNTILIDRADRFGMSQLYQLRGRVGRSTEQAYCYLLTPSYRRMTDDARKRLKAIEAHTELGSGFALAMRDLEIRGAGNLLGAKQSGYIDDIGFDMYTKLLEETVAELKGEHLGRLTETTLELDEDAYLPSKYIDINQHKVDVYQRLAESRSLSHIARIRVELRDRYGKLPEPVVNLVEATALKLVGAQLDVQRIQLRSGRVEITFGERAQFGRRLIEKLRQAIDEPMEFTSGGHAVTIDLSALKRSDRVGYLRTRLEQVSAETLDQTQITKHV